ncbi:MAG: hypothetical protein K0U98_26600 [Deltaproteobacteria bacterium]|nr:hypothetical protein [Deltaproteobacteria bacterium]
MKKTPLPMHLLLVAALFLGSSAEAGDVKREILVPEGWEGAYDFGYAPAIRVGDQIILSGIPNGGSGDYEERTRRMYQRAVELLEAAGASLDDVIELTTFHTESKTSAAFREEFARYMPIHREFFGEHRPVWTAVGTSVLLSPNATVEMRVMAIAGSGAQSEVVRPKRDQPEQPSESADPPKDAKEKP